MLGVIDQMEHLVVEVWVLKALSQAGIASRTRLEGLRESRCILKYCRISTMLGGRPFLTPDSYDLVDATEDETDDAGTPGTCRDDEGVVHEEDLEGGGRAIVVVGDL